MQNPFPALNGSKTYIVGAVYIVLTVLTGAFGWQVAGYTPDPDWLQHSIAALGAMAIRHGISTSMVAVAESLATTLAPVVLPLIQAQTNPTAPTDPAAK